MTKWVLFVSFDAEESREKLTVLSSRRVTHENDNMEMIIATITLGDS